MTRITGTSVAKWMLLSSTCVTAALTLWDPTSATARAADAHIGELVATAILALAAIGWADVLWTDIGGRVILPSIQTPVRHRLCVLYYSALTSVYMTYALAGLDPRVEISWILLVHYLLMSLGGAALTLVIAKDERSEMFGCPARNDAHDDMGLA